MPNEQELAEPTSEELHQLRIDLADDSRYALSILEDAQGFLFRLAEMLDEQVTGPYADDLRVCQHALAKVRDNLEEVSENASTLYEAHKEE